MTFLEALQKTTEEIKAWAESKFSTEKNVDTALSDTSTNTVQNKVITAALNNTITGLSVNGRTITYTKLNGSTGNITTQDTTYNTATTSATGLMSPSDKTNLDNLVTYVGNKPVSEQINNALSNLDLSNAGIYVQSYEPTDAKVGDIWIDTANDPIFFEQAVPEITESDNGKVLMVVNGQYKLVNLNLLVDDNGVLSM